MPTLNWIGKDAVVNHDKEVPFRLLRKVKSASVGDNSQNLIIHGDNLEALKALMPYYGGKVKCIYIDPPYNTGNEKWIYNDKVNSPKIKKWLGKVVGKELEDLTRHDKWLCMMYPRLKLLRDLLSSDGAIFISIDDNEYIELKFLCDELFGENNFFGSICVKMSHLSGVKMSHVEKKIPKLKEYLLIYAKDKPKLNLLPVYENVDIEKTFSRYKSFLIRDHNTPLNLKKWQVIPLNEAMKRAHIDKNNKQVLNDFYIKNASNIFRTARNHSEQFRSLPNDSFFHSVQTTTGLSKIAYKREEVVFVSSKLESDSLVQPLGDIWMDIGINNLHNEGDVIFKNGKKPLKLLQRILSMFKSKDITVLDSFAGSGTTGHAVMTLNQKDGGDRRFILIEMEDHVAKDITAERIKRVVKKYDYDGGFEYCELSKPLFNEAGHIEEECDFNQFATYIYFTETQTNIDPKVIDGNYIGEKTDTEYYLIYKGKGKNVLDKSFLKKVRKSDAKKIVYADFCDLDDKVLEDFGIVFKQIPYEVKVY